MEVSLFSTEPNGWFSRPMAELWKEFSRDFDRRPEGHIVPPADVIEEADAYRLEFEMPGLKSESIDARVEDDTLIVEATRVRPERPKDASVHLAERVYGPLRRTFRLPEDASPDGIKASYTDGVLEVTVAKKPESKPFKIKVNSRE